METLLSFELLVDNIQLDRDTKVSDELAVALRLLDFPTLIIYQPEHREVNKGEGEYTFNRGKACFFKMNLDLLHRHLSSTPLYAMVLDVKEEMPKFIGSSHISLEKVMGRIKRDVAERGVSTPSSHGQRGTVGIINLKGKKVGTISLSYKFLSLGSNLLSHVNTMDSQHTKVICLKESKKEADELSANSENVQKSNSDKGHNISKNEEATKQETISSTCQETDCYGEDMSVFCPPHLYYNNSAEERSRYEDEGRTQLKSNFDAFTDTEDVTDKTVPLNEQKHNVVNSIQQKQVSRDETPNVIGQALQQMPLLNALLVELSQLNSPNANQCLNVHPNLAWIYRRASIDTSAVEKNTSQKLQNESKNREVASSKLKDLYSPRHCSTPLQKERRSTPRKKLVYGTTKSSDLRLKRISPAVVKQRECVDLIEGKTPVNTNRDKSKVVKKLAKSPKRSTKSSKLTENIETMIQNITDESMLQEVPVENQAPLDVSTPIGTPQEDRRITEKHLLFERSSMQMPTNVESDSSAKISQSSTDSHSGKRSGSSRSSVDSSVSDRSGGEDDYADDFNSFEPSDAFSTDPTSPSPELQRPKNPKSHSDLGRSSDSSPESVQKSIKSRPVIPVPIKASRSPQRALRGTYTIQRQTFGVSFSSEDGDKGRASSKLSAYSGKQFRDSSREERSSGESWQSSGDHRSELDKSTRAITRISDDSSFEHKTEGDDELGTLDFRKEYKHISELVSHKLPGYTM